ncbi:hypothetical protein [Actinoallomurus acaciae]|uniref:hypothetical protein n=1 Tax=Actinoallomurus acaciae TaxID=502577 RepID=UPI00366CDE7C
MLTRVIAGFRKEVPARTLESIQRAGVGVYRALDDADAVRQDLAAQGVSAWRMPAAAAAQQLYAWNAYVLQTLGDKMIDADYRADSRTAGYLPKVTAEQVWAFFGQVERWLSLSRQAAANPGYRVQDPGYLPADLPGWVEIEPCPAAHLEAMIAACAAVREHAEVALGTFEITAAPDGRHTEIARLRQLAAEAGTSSDYAMQAFDPAAGRRLHEVVEERLRRALEIYYHLGQLIAMPSLLKTYGRRGGAGPTAGRLPLPGSGDFDPWCLTERDAVRRRQRDPQARRAINDLWRGDPDPASTLAIQDQLNAALRRDDIRRTGAMYYAPPWAPIYRAQRPVVIGNRRLQPGQDFTFEVSAEPLRYNHPFIRQIVTGPFHQARR